MNKQTKTSLRQWQQQFRTALTAEKTSATPFLRGRMGVYRDAFFGRIHDSLIEDFPNLHKRLGSAKFEKLCRQFVLQSPSQFSSLAELSKAFVPFIYAKKWNNLALVAELDWYECLAFLAPEPEVPLVDFKTLDENDEMALSRLVLALHPSVHIAHHILIWRCGSVKRETLQAWEEKLLRQLQPGISFLNFTDWLSKNKLKQNRVQSFFAKWSQLGAVIGFERHGVLH